MGYGVAHARVVRGDCIGVVGVWYVSVQVWGMGCWV